jgi:hypothetical protein
MVFSCFLSFDLVFTFSLKTIGYYMSMLIAFSPRFAGYHFKQLFKNLINSVTDRMSKIFVFLILVTFPVLSTVKVISSFLDRVTLE